HDETLRRDSYQNLRHTTPETDRAALFAEALPALIAALDYAAVSDGPIDLLAYVGDRLQQVSMQLGILVNQVDVDASRYVKEAVVDEVSFIYEALVGTNRAPQ